MRLTCIDQSACVQWEVTSQHVFFMRANLEGRFRCGETRLGSQWHFPANNQSDSKLLREHRTAVVLDGSRTVHSTNEPSAQELGAHWILLLRIGREGRRREFSAAACMQRLPARAWLGSDNAMDTTAAVVRLTCVFNIECA